MRGARTAVQSSPELRSISICRWKPHILRSLVLVGEQRYNALLKVIEGISPKELTRNPPPRNLRELESAGLIQRTEYPNATAYALTLLGTELEAPFRALGIFGTNLAAHRALATR
jgi:DNA-binding HxlR family transcriptional regulator